MPMTAASGASSPAINDDEEAKFASLLGDFNLLKEIAATLLLPATATAGATATTTVNATAPALSATSPVVQSLVLSNKVILNVTASFHQYAFEVHRWCMLQQQQSVDGAAASVEAAPASTAVGQLEGHLAACRQLFAKAAQLASWSVLGKQQQQQLDEAATTTVVVGAVAGLLCNQTCKLRVRLALHNLEQAVHHVAKRCVAAAPTAVDADPAVVGGDALRAQVDGLKSAVVSLKSAYEQLVRSVHPPPPPPPTSGVSGSLAGEEASQRHARVQLCLQQLELLSGLSRDAICTVQEQQRNKANDAAAPATAPVVPSKATCTVVNPRTLAFQRPNPGVPLGVSMTLKESASSTAYGDASQPKAQLELVITGLPGHPHVTLMYGKPAVVVAVNGLSNPKFPNAMLSTIESAQHSVVVEVQADAFVLKPQRADGRAPSKKRANAKGPAAGDANEPEAPTLPANAGAPPNDAAAVEARNTEVVDTLAAAKPTEVHQPTTTGRMSVPSSDPAVAAAARGRRPKRKPKGSTDVSVVTEVNVAPLTATRTPRAVEEAVPSQPTLDNAAVAVTPPTKKERRSSRGAMTVEARNQEVLANLALELLSSGGSGGGVAVSPATPPPTAVQTAATDGIADGRRTPKAAIRRAAAHAKKAAKTDAVVLNDVVEVSPETPSAPAAADGAVLPKAPPEAITIVAGGITIVKETPDRWVLHRGARTEKWGIRGTVRKLDGRPANKETDVLLVSAIGATAIDPPQAVRLVGDTKKDLTLVVEFQQRPRRGPTKAGVTTKGAAPAAVAPSVDAMATAATVRPVIDGASVDAAAAPNVVYRDSPTAAVHEILDDRTLKLRRASTDVPWGVRFHEVRRSGAESSVALAAAGGVVLSRPQLRIHRINGNAVHNSAMALRQLDGATESILELEAGARLTVDTTAKNPAVVAVPLPSSPAAAQATDASLTATSPSTPPVTLEVLDDALVFQRAALTAPWPVAIAPRRVAAAVQKVRSIEAGQCLLEITDLPQMPSSHKKQLQRLMTTAVVPGPKPADAAAAATKRFVFATAVNGTAYQRVGDYKHAIAAAKKRLMLTCAKRK